MNKVLVLCFGLAATSALAEDLDNRQLLTLTESQRGHVLEEMRVLLSGTQAILAALAKDDMTAVAQYARRLGMGMADKAEDHLKGALPKEFMQLGMSVHQDFDQIATDAESLKDPKHTLWQLSESMNKCAVCHASYQIRIVKQPLKRVRQTKHHELSITENRTEVLYGGRNRPVNIRYKLRLFFEAVRSSLKF